MTQGASGSSSPDSSTARVLRGLFELRPAPPKRWMFALRAAICIGAPILIGWILGDTSAGLMASIGGFTSLYGAGRPYLSRARHLAVIALAFAVVVGLGLHVAASPAAAVIVVAAIAMVATWLSNALQVGPPGAYMFTLACATATAMPGAHVAPLTAATLVLAGGAFAWLMQMGGAWFNPRGPERRVIADADSAVTAFIQAVGTTQESTTRHRAAFALHHAWSVLVGQQPARARAGGELSRLRALNRELHLLFAEAMEAASRHRLPPPDLLAKSRALAADVYNPKVRPAVEAESIPLGHPGALDALAESLRPGSNSWRVVVRVGCAAIVVSMLGAMLHLERAYWAVAATVLMLHQGFDWLRMVQRSLERLLGTWAGLLLAGAILALHPQGLWLALVVMALQFTIEMLVLRNYALAAVFITGAALTIASGGHPVVAPGHYLLARGVDTLVGCVVALIVFWWIPPRAALRRIPEQIVNTLRSVSALMPHVSTGNVTTTAARSARRDVQRASLALTNAYEESLAASRSERRNAELLWPTIAAVERLAYRTLSTCWSLERLGIDAARNAAMSMFGENGAAHVSAEIEGLVDSIVDGKSPPAMGPLPEVLESELRTVQECLVSSDIKSI